METVNINLAGMNGDTGYGVVASEKPNAKEKEGGQVKNGSIYAGNINSMMSDRIEQKREMARKQATKILMDQFGRDEEVTDGLDELRARNREIKEEISQLCDEKEFYRTEQEALQEKYGITADSEEQKELELIRRAKDALREGRLGNLSKEELEQVANTGELTEYQQRALEYDSVIELYDAEIRELQKESHGNTSAIQSGKMALLKTGYKGINAAKKAADTILDSASDEIRGMLWEEAKQQVDEEMEKLIEAAKEKAEEKEELEEKLDSAEEKKEEQKGLSEGILESEEQQEQLQSELDKILKEAELFKEDLKGLVVDGIL